MFLAGNGSSMASNGANLKAQVQGPSLKLAAADGVPVNQPISTPHSALSSPLSVSSHTGAQSGSGSTSTDELMAAKPTGVPSSPVSKVEPPKMINAVGSVAASPMMPSGMMQSLSCSVLIFSSQSTMCCEKSYTLAPSLLLFMTFFVAFTMFHFTHQEVFCCLD